MAEGDPPQSEGADTTGPPAPGQPAAGPDASPIPGTMPLEDTMAALGITPDDLDGAENPSLVPEA